MAKSLQPESAEAILRECREKLDLAEMELLAWNGNVAQESRAPANRIWEAFNDLRGIANVLGHEPLAQLSRLSAAVLSAVRNGHTDLNRANVNVLLSAADRMRQMAGEGNLRFDVQFTVELESLSNILRQAGGLNSGVDAKNEIAKPALRVLVVEDDFASRVLLNGILSAYGACHIAVNGKEAIQAFRAAREAGQGYHLICMDINMPEMNGFEAVQQIRAIEKGESIYSSGVKVFMTTSERDIKAVVGAFKVLCDAYVFKPIDRRKLEEHLITFGLISGT